MSRTLAALVILLCSACGASQPEPAVPDVAAIRTQIDSLWTRYAAAAVAGDVDGIAKLYDGSPLLIEAGLPTLRTGAELRSTVEQVLGSVRFIESSIQPELTEVVGDRVLQFGSYRDVMQPTGQPVQVVQGRFAAVLMRDSTSAWRVSRIVAFTDSTVPQVAVRK